jgi:hypothetical protein
MPDGSRPAPPYPTPPSSDDERILAAIRASRPEEIPGLSWTAPDFLATDHKIIRKFAIGAKKRPDGEYIPCAICSGGHPKFLEGAVLWSPDGWLRLIGHVCAAKDEHFGEARYREFIKQREQEDLDNITLAWMEVNVAALKPVAASVREFLKNVLFWEEQQKIFFRGVGELAEALEDIARRHGGVLSVVQESSGAQLVAAAMRGAAAASSIYETISIGSLSGSSFVLRPSQKRSRQLEGMLEALARVPDGEGDEPLLTMIGRDGEREITITTGLVFRAMQRAAKLADEFTDAQAFFTPENLTLLDSWGVDKRNPRPFSMQRNGPRVTFALPDKSKATLPTIWPKLPDLSALRSIVTADIELDGVLKRHKM